MGERMANEEMVKSYWMRLFIELVLGEEGRLEAALSHFIGKCPSSSAAEPDSGYSDAAQSVSPDTGGLGTVKASDDTTCWQMSAYFSNVLDQEDSTCVEESIYLGRQEGGEEASPSSETSCANSEGGVRSPQRSMWHPPRQAPLRARAHHWRLLPSSGLLPSCVTADSQAL